MIGADAERRVIAEIAGRRKDAIDLGGRASLARFASVCRRACVANCRTVVRFFRDLDPARRAPQGVRVVVIRRKRPEDLSVDEIWRDGGLAAGRLWCP